ncbi:ferritin [Paenibacillus sp. SN-8-1]|uniref:ferritin n=1 Tax=Paenibacillus sp. SN-8-1 TaxID=3435409 RepID=UPI003D9A7311
MDDLVKESLYEALNEQFNFELHSAHVYLAIAGYCSAVNWDGFANFFLVQAEEERFHASKIYKFLNDRGRRVLLSALEEPKNDYDSILDAFEHAYKHEQVNTQRIYHLSDLALDDREHATLQFLSWFIEEQVEEEALFDGIIQKLKRIDVNSTAFFELDKEFGGRSFSPEA